MKSLKKITVLLLVAAMMLGTLAACGGAGDDAASANAVNIPIALEPESLDSSRANETVATQLSMETQETLIRYDENNNVIPAGAEKWEISPDGTVYTFHLRENKWSDGTTVTAGDYANGLLRALDPVVASAVAANYYTIKGAEDYNSGKTDRESVGIKALDDKTLEITLNGPVPYFILTLNAAAACPVPEKLTEGDANITYGADETTMLFSGPFMISTYERGSKIITVKNPNFWDAENVHIETVNYLLAQDENTRGQMFKQGELDLLTDINAKYIEEVQSEIDAGKFLPVRMPKPTNGYIAFNCEDSTGLFANAKVRLAFSLGFDREAYVTHILQKDLPAYGFVPPVTNNVEGKFRDNAPEPLKDLNIDPKALLQEGLAELGMSAEGLTVELLQSNSNAGTKARSEYFMNQWKTNLGVEVKLETSADGAAFNNSIKTGDYQIIISGWGADYNDPMTFMQMFTTGDANNSAHYSNARYDELVWSAASENDLAVRAEKFAEAERLLVLEEAGVAPLTYGFGTNIINPALKGVIFNPAGGPSYELRFATLETPAAE